MELIAIISFCVVLFIALCGIIFGIGSIMLSFREPFKWNEKGDDCNEDSRV